MKKLFNKDKENVKEINRYNPSFKEGLSVYQAEKRKADGLINKNKVKISNTYLKIIFKNVFTFFNILLISIGIILIIFKLYSSCVFLVILLLNLTIGLTQDIKAKRAVDKLSLIEKDKIVVVRDSKEIEINSDELVLDDIIFCTKNTKIPCDSILIEGNGQVDESLLTGESLPSKKTLNSDLFSGTYVTSGEFYARVDKVGADNYISKLQLKSKEFKKPHSKMFTQLNSLFRVIGILVIVIGILDLIEFGIVGILEKSDDIESIYDWLRNSGIVLQVAGSLVSMIPSGMYLLTSMTLSVGVLTLANQKVLVKDMYAQETLARVDTLCIDKTGTITDGSMSVFNYELIDNSLKKDRFEALIASYCNKLGNDNDTSKALLNYFTSKEIFEVKSYIPFSSVYKYSAAEIENNGTLVIGAYNFFPLKNSIDVKEKVESASSAGFRVIVVALSKNKIKDDKLPTDLTCTGIIYLQDHIREEAKKSIKWFNDNDVSIKVISGDNPLTVKKIAEAAGVKDSEKWISLDNLSDDEVKASALKYNVFGRVTPEQKELIVKTLRENDKTVAMVGDGVNDVLSLKRADVAIGLESGSKASKDIANIILLNNDFTKLPDVVYQGRRVINNLERTCSLFLTKTVFAIFLNVYFLFSGLFTSLIGNNAQLWPFATNNFYAWELITIGIASFFLALEPNINIIKGSFIKNVIRKAAPNGIIMGLTIEILYLVSFIGHDMFNKTELLNIATLFISISSFIPLLDVSRPFNKYRRGVFIGALILVCVLYLWSMYQFNWLNINGIDSSAPRYISGDEWIAFLCMLSGYIVILLIYKLFRYGIPKAIINKWKK